jgi:hypothetical protein
MKKLIIIIAAALVLIVGALVTLSMVGPETSIYKLAPQVSTLTQDSDDYIVYFSSPTCSHCADLESDAVSFYNAATTSGTVDMFLVDMSQPESRKYYTQSTDVANVTYYTDEDAIPEGYDIETFKISGTPEAIHVVDGKIVDIAIGTKGEESPSSTGGVANMFEDVAAENGFEYDAKINN